MKNILANKMVLLVIGVVGVAVVGVVAYVIISSGNDEEIGGGDNTAADSAGDATDSDDDFQRTGQNSFGLAVCEEMSADQVADVIGKEVVKTEDYSNSMSTGCEYYVADNHFVIIDVGYDDMEDQRKGLEFLERTIETDDRIGLENMLVYSENGLIDVYMNVEPGQKFVRVGRSSTTAVDEETLIQLAIATEAKIRSFK